MFTWPPNFFFEKVQKSKVKTQLLNIIIIIIIIFNSIVTTIEEA